MMCENSLPNFNLTEVGPISRKFQTLKIKRFHEALKFVQHLPYGRNKDRSNYNLVLEEMQGTCSTKHALLAALCKEQGITDIQLMIGIYEMNEQNTPGIGIVLKEAGLQSIPEAHCYLMFENDRYDFTRGNVESEPISNLLVEVEITPEQIGKFKLDLHRSYIPFWLKNKGYNQQFSESLIWVIREKCIEALSKSNS